MPDKSGQYVYRLIRGNARASVCEISPDGLRCIIIVGHLKRTERGLIVFLVLYLFSHSFLFSPTALIFAVYSCAFFGLLRPTAKQVENSVQNIQRHKGNSAIVKHYRPIEIIRMMKNRRTYTYKIHNYSG